MTELLEELSEKNFIDICDYRWIPEKDQSYPVKAISTSMTAFQDMVTIFFGAIRDKAKARAVYAQEIVAGAELNVGFSYSGSLGMVFFARNDQLFRTGSDLDLAFEAITALSKQDSTAGVRTFSEKYGRAAVKAFYTWSKSQTSYGYSADIKWKRGAEVKLSRLFQPQELDKVCALIDSVNDVRNDPVILTGVLYALNINNRTFGMAIQDAETIHGKMADSFNAAEPHPVPGVYTATLNRRSQVSSLSDEPIVSWELILLEPPISI